jgi:plasmid stability protein
MQIRVRDLPDALHRDLKVWAAQEQITLNDLVLNILKAAVEKRQGKK